MARLRRTRAKEKRKAKVEVHAAVRCSFESRALAVRCTSWTWFPSKFRMPQRSSLEEKEPDDLGRGACQLVHLSR